jgi:hypothetical protein
MSVGLIPTQQQCRLIWCNKVACSPLEMCRMKVRKASRGRHDPTRSLSLENWTSSSTRLRLRSLALSRRQLRRFIATDLDSVFGTREALPHLLKTRGSVINVAYLSGLGKRLGVKWLQSGKKASTDATVDLEKSGAVMAALGKVPGDDQVPLLAQLFLVSIVQQFCQPH